MKAKRPRRAPAAAPTKLVLSDRMRVSAALLVAGKDGGPDAPVVELFLSWCANRVLQDALIEEARGLRVRAQAEGRSEEACPALRALRRTNALISDAQDALLKDLASAPSESPRGLALKLLLWRFEGCPWRTGELEEVHEIAVYSAYRDALAQAGLEALAHPRDADTDALLRAGKALKGEQD